MNYEIGQFIRYKSKHQPNWQYAEILRVDEVGVGISINTWYPNIGSMSGKYHSFILFDGIEIEVIEDEIQFRLMVE